MLKIISWILVLSSFTTAYQSQILNSEYMLDIWNREDGLPQKTINAITQTVEGYVWVGVSTGLLRFDGFSFYQYDSRNIKELVSNEVTTLITNLDGDLAIGTNGGGLIIKKGEEFTRYNLDQGLSSDFIKGLGVRNDSGIMISMSNGFSLYRRHQLKPVTLPNDNFYETVSAVAMTATGIPLFIDANHQLFCIESSGAIISLARDQTPFNTISACAGKPENWIIGTESGELWRLQNGIYTLLYSAHSAISSLLIDKSGRYWIGTKSSGLLLYDHGQSFHFTQKQNIANQRILSLFEDREGSIWIGSEGGGLKRIRHRKVKSLSEELEGTIINGMFLDGDSIIWIATNGQGLKYLRRNQLSSFSKISAKINVCCVLKDSRNRLWIGSAGNGLFCYEKQNLREFGYRDGLISLTNNVIYEDSRHIIWLGTQDGLMKYENNHFISFLDRDGKANNGITAILEDHQGTLWVGTNGGGLVALKNHDYHNYTPTDGLAHGVIRSIYEDADHYLWIGTDGGGISCYKDGYFYTITTTQGLPDDYIQGILEKNHRFWISSKRGIMCIERSDLIDLVQSKTDYIYPVNYGLNEGMSDEECNGGFQPSAFFDSQGIFYFPTFKGVMSIQANKESAPPPQTMIERVMINGRTFDVNNKIEWKVNEKNIEFHYSSIHFQTPEQIYFKYRLMGFDDRWVHAKSRRTAFYSNLPSGDYQFEVTSMNHDGIWDTEGIRLDFKVLPLFYQTWPFYLLMGSILLILASGFYGFRIRQMRHRQLELQQIIEIRTHDLQLTLASLNQEKENISLANRIIEKKNQNIMAGIRYAQRIQNSILPTMDYIQDILHSFFIVYLPKDVISGDFYWVYRKNMKKIVAVVDCTGHGVPGAFMSIIGYSLLNQIVVEKNIWEPSQILGEMHTYIRYVLQQDEIDANTMDGMDVALCLIDEEAGNLSFAGAKRPLYYVSDKKLFELKGDQKSIGGRQKEAKRMFTTHILPLDIIQTFFMVSDGFVDQQDYKDCKFGVSRFKNMLLNISEYDLESQKKELLHALKAHQQQEEQRDDITIFGVALR